MTAIELEIRMTTVNKIIKSKYYAKVIIWIREKTKAQIKINLKLY